MRKFNWDSITATSEGGFKSLPAGPYVARVTDATDNTEKEYVEIIFDIAEGEHAGFYSDDWGKSHTYAHHFFMSYKETAAGMLKGRLEAFASSNPGFDPFAAWEAGRLDMFHGRIIGINLQEEEYETSDGDIRTRLNVCQVVDVQRVRNGKMKTRELKKLSGKPAPSTKPVEVYAGEIPFD